MLIEIPDDLARKAKRSMTRCRNAAQCRSDAALAESQGRPIAAVLDLMYAALLEADLPEPIQVGHLVVERCVPAVLDAHARPTDDLWASVWRRLGTARPRTKETTDG